MSVYIAQAAIVNEETGQVRFHRLSGGYAYETLALAAKVAALAEEKGGADMGRVIDTATGRPADYQAYAGYLPAAWLADFDVDVPF